MLVLPIKKKKFDLVRHPECSHNWIHYAGKQCEWDNGTYWDKKKNKVVKRQKDSNNVAYIYICTMCQGEFWSYSKMFDIPHYRVKGVQNIGKE